MIAAVPSNEEKIALARRLPSNEGRLLVLLIPTLAHTWIKRGSAVVARLCEWEAYLSEGGPAPTLYFEGGLNEPMSFQDRLCAAGTRLHLREPSVAMCTPSRAGLYESVGVLQPAPWGLWITDERALVAWGVAPDEIRQASQPPPA